MWERIKALFTNENERLRRRLTIFVTVIFVLVGIIILLIIPVVAYQFVYLDKIYQGVRVDGVELGGLTRMEAVNKLHQLTDNIRDKGIDFYYDSKHFTLNSTIISPSDPDLSYDLFYVDVQNIIRDAYNIGRDHSILASLYEQGKALFVGVHVYFDYTILENDLREILVDNFKDQENPGVDATLIFTEDGYEITEERSGVVFDYDTAIELFKRNFNLVSNSSIPLRQKADIPKITKADIEENTRLVTQALKNGDLTLTYSIPYYEQEWKVDKEEIKNWLKFTKNERNEVGLTFNGKLEEKLVQIAKEVNIDPQDAKFHLENGRVQEFEPSRSGVTLDIEATQQVVTSGFFDSEVSNEFEIVTKETPATVLTEDLNDLGIKEIIAVGESDFAGSSELRIKNIRRASELLNGVLIKPGEEFSLVAILGDITAANGYFPEWVIKGDRTVKEYGGGLCQIGTTMFRGALNAGVPVTERRNHSYAVSYYKPFGTDATIYGPHPDFRFVNDTNNYILIQSRVEPPKLYYEFWGTKDGRKVDITDPSIYNIKPPGPRKLIEVDTLPPGEIRCVERARNGLDAYFDRVVYNADGSVKIDERYNSHYRSWPEICEIGIDPDAEPTEEGVEGIENSATKEEVLSED